VRTILAVFAVFFMFATSAQSRKYLHQNWSFKQEGKTASYPAKVPGTVQQDLRSNGVIEDLYFENNEHRYQWIEKQNWLYETHFTLSKSDLLKGQQFLVFEGLDTYAEVYLNDSLILSATNMFRRWKSPVSGLVHLGQNNLKIRFISPINQHREQYINAPYHLPAGAEAGAIKVSPYTRKAAYHFGWDWGPRIVCMGVFKDLYLETSDGFFIDNHSVETLSLTDGKAIIGHKIRLEGVGAQQNKSIELQNKSSNIRYKPSLIDKEYRFHQEILNPKMWWPNGWGEAYLYKDTLQLWVNDTLVQEFPYRYGLRQISLVQETDNGKDSSFYFLVNGKAIFALGANYIPQDLLLPKVTNQQYRNLLIKAQKANINMLRVWGGGVYEKDIFYDLCDSLGLLVWQDFMFAGSMYPGDSSFLADVQQELEDNILRLRRHPSLAIWCGNNEMEVAWFNWGWSKQFNYSAIDSLKIWTDYQKLFHQQIPQTLSRLDPGRAYTPTSPLSNWGAKGNFNHGTMHYWGVWHGKEKFDAFDDNVGRFMVEYGFQSFPALSTLASVMADSSLYLESLAMQNRQKSYVGNGLIKEHVRRNFGDYNTFEEFVVLSQQNQALGLQIAIRAHRKQRGHCMGSMFWQLNDCWPGPSWSVIDYYGNEKEAYKTVRENFKGILFFSDGNGVWLLHDKGLRGTFIVGLKGVLQKRIPVDSESGQAHFYSFKELGFKAEASQINMAFTLQ
jgi:beta-mannosidase